MAGRGAVVLRYEPAGEVIRRAFDKLRPEVTYDVAEKKLSVTIGARDTAKRGASGAAAELPVLSHALGGIEQMAADADGPVAVILEDPFLGAWLRHAQEM